MQKNKIIIALKKARSSIDRTLIMIDDERTNDNASDRCFSVLQQNLAAIGLIKSANVLVLERHIDDVLAGSVNTITAKKQKELRNELIKVIVAAQKK